MAVARPPRPAESSGLKAALIVFIVMTVASLGFAIYLFTQQEESRTQLEAARQQAGRANQQMNEARQKADSFMKKVIGDNADVTLEQTAVEQAISEAVQPVLADEGFQKASAIELNDLALIPVLKDLYTLYRGTADQLAQSRQQLDQLEQEMSTLNANTERKLAEFNQMIDQMTEKVQTLEQENAENRQNWEESIEAKAEELAAANQELSQAEQKLKSQADEYEKKLAEAGERVQDLQKTLASFRPSVDTFAALRIADGTVVQAPAGEDIVYISIGRNEGIKEGLTFEVYSRHENIPTDGKGKASVRVTNVFESTAECRVIDTTPGDPIIEGDLVANPVFAKGRQYTYVVAGDFDLDFDGDNEDAGGREVARLIRQAGGKVDDKVSARTDYVVLGNEPPEPKELTEDAEDDAAIELQQQQSAALKEYQKVVEQARLMGIPTINRSQFLSFFGYGSQGKNAKNG